MKRPLRTLLAAGMLAAGTMGTNHAQETTNIGSIESVVELSEYENSRLQRLAPIVDEVGAASAHYGFEPEPMLQMLLLESSLLPMAFTAEDFGLGQQRPGSFERMYELGLDPESEYHSPDLEPGHGIYHPETHVTTFMISHAFNRNEIDSADPAMLYAYYARGPAGATRNGLTEEGQRLEGLLRTREDQITRLTPLLDGIDSEDVPDPITRSTLQAYQNKGGPEDAYRSLLDENLEMLPTEGVPTVQDTLLYNNALQFALVLDHGYGHDMSETYDRLETIGEHIGTTSDPEIENLKSQADVYFHRYVSE